MVFFTYVKGQLVAVLHRRGEFTFTDELEFRAESWPGGCQVSSHGKWKDGDGEGDMGALYREVREELGDATAQLVMAQRSQLKVLSTKDGPDEEVKTYGLLVQDPRELLPYIRLGSESGGLILATYDCPIANLREFDKVKGVPERGTVAMFDDERDAVKQGFAIYAAA